MSDRPCTCPPEDNPPVPCERKYALTACREARLWAQYDARRANGFKITCGTLLTLFVGVDLWLVWLIWFSR